MRERWINLACAIFVLSLTALALQSSGERALISTEEPYSLGKNLTLVAEDADPSSKAVWIDIYHGNSTFVSGILGLGRSISCQGINLTIAGIYAGGKNDLIAIEVERTNATGNGTAENVSSAAATPGASMANASKATSLG